MRTILASIVAVVVITAFFGFAYPAVMTGFAQVTFQNKANGSLVDARGGSSARSWRRRASRGRSTSTSVLRARRPRTTPARRRSSTSARRIPISRSSSRQNAQAILKLEKPYNPGLTIHQIPVDAVVTSASGIDPDISPAYAQLQARRVAAVRHLPLSTVQKLISENTDGRGLGFFGEPGVNVLELNLALDKLGGK